MGGFRSTEIHFRILEVLSSPARAFSSGDLRSSSSTNAPWLMSFISQYALTSLRTSADTPRRCQSLLVISLVIPCLHYIVVSLLPPYSGRGFKRLGTAPLTHVRAGTA